MVIQIKDITHKTPHEKKSRDPLVMKRKDVKAKKWEPKKVTQAQNMEKRKEDLEVKLSQVKIKNQVENATF